jgi:hypothetical protein
MMLEMWFRTVLGASVSWAAIAVLLCPAVTIARISRSRSVSLGKGPDACCPLKRSVTRRATAEPEHAATVGYGLHGAHDRGFAGALQQVAAGTYAQGCEHRIIVSEHGKHKDRDAWAAMSNPAGGLNAAHTRHLKVHDHHVRLQLEAERDRLPSIGRPTDNIEGRCSQRRPKPVSVKVAIIANQYA